MSTEYAQFVESKLAHDAATGMESPPPTPSWLAPFQSDLVTWALRRGRAALFADTGLGKTRMQIAWADAVRRHTGRPVLILAPLAVAAQTVEESRRVGVEAVVAREQIDAPLVVTNYERLHRFDPRAFGAVVLDESSCIKHHDTRTLKTLLDAFRSTPWKLCATATPSPNDYTELGTHAEFLGVCSRTEMLSEFFVHDGGDTSTWRLKGHARAAFWRFVATWGALVRSPATLGYDDGAYRLPPLKVEEHIIGAAASDTERAGLLFAREAQTLSERRAARKASLDARVRQCVERVNRDRQPWVVWCDLNAESDALSEAIDGAVEVRGSDTIDEKEARLSAFGAGRSRVIVSKPSICGWGLNWQHAARMAFVGVTDSWESYYQAIRRCWRFGQVRPVEVHVYASELEGAVVANLRRKEEDALRMAEELGRETAAAVREQVHGQKRVSNPYNARKRMEIPSWLKSA